MRRPGRNTELLISQGGVLPFLAEDLPKLRRELGEIREIRSAAPRGERLHQGLTLLVPVFRTRADTERKQSCAPFGFRLDRAKRINGRPQFRFGLDRVLLPIAQQNDQPLFGGIIPKRLKRGIEGCQEIRLGFESQRAQRLPEGATIRIGGFWDEQGYSGLEEGWYRLRYKCPELPEGKRVFLHFESVDESAWLYVDGKLVAWYDTAYPNQTWNRPFLLEATGNIESGAEHLLAIRVGNVAGAGGIYQPVSLMVEK